MSTSVTSVAVQSSEFPTDVVARSGRRLEAIVQYHRAGVGYAKEHERLLRVTIMETESLLEQLKRFEAEKGLATGELRTPAEPVLAL